MSVIGTSGWGISLRQMARETLDAIERGSYILGDVRYNLAGRIEISKQGTQYYPPDSPALSDSASSAPFSTPPLHETDISILEISTLDGARLLSNNHPCSIPPAVLNFASAKTPGGGFIGGAKHQEESIARSSTLHSSLTTSAAESFYKMHKRDPKGGYYSHAMIYSPGVVVFRDDSGGWTTPLEVDVLTSPAVNAGAVRQNFHGGEAEEAKIEATMRERMARILLLFEQQGAKNLVLGSFGTGAFRNDVAMVARIWAALVGVKGGQFKDVFDRVIIATLGKDTFEQFGRAFNERVKERVKGDKGRSMIAQASHVWS